MKPRAVETGDHAVTDPAEGRRHRHRKACDRRRRPELALPRRRRHRDRRLDLSAGRADVQSPSHPPAPRHLNRIPHRERTVHAWCRCRATGRASSAWSIRRSRAPRRARRRVVIAEESRRRAHSILGKIEVEAGAACFRLRSRPRGGSGATASRWSARPRIFCRRSARRAQPRAARCRDDRRAGRRRAPRRRRHRRA